MKRRWLADPSMLAIAAALTGCDGAAIVHRADGGADGGVTATTRALRGAVPTRLAGFAVSRVHVINARSGRTVATATPDAQGQFTIPNVPAGGTYKVTAQAGQQAVPLLFPRQQGGAARTNLFNVGARTTPRAGTLDGPIDVGAITESMDDGETHLTPADPARAPNMQEDFDNDGTPDGADADVDGDGTPNAMDTDNDGDGTPDNAAFGDNDGDGITNESDPDLDGDGTPNATDTDNDNDGVSDDMDTSPNGDVRGSPEDSDGDGIPNTEDTTSADDAPPSFESWGASTNPGEYDDTTDYADTDDLNQSATCMVDCMADPDLAAARVCGSDRMTHTACEFLCEELSSGVEVVPGACGAEGAPPAGSPPFTNGRVCNWNAVTEGDGSTRWVPLMCATQLDEFPVGGPEVRSSPAAHDIPMGTPAPVAAAPMTPVDSADHRTRYPAVKQQGALGACSAYGSTTALEGALSAALGAPTALSVSNVWYNYCQPNLGQARDALSRGTITEAEAMRLGVGFDVHCGEDDSSCTALPAACFRAAEAANNTCQTNARNVWNTQGWMAGQTARSACYAVPTAGRPAEATSAVTTLEGSATRWRASVTTLVPRGAGNQYDPAVLARIITDGADLVGAIYTNDSFNRGGAPTAMATGCGTARDGVMTDESVRHGGHVVALVGVVQRNGRRYFVTRNSWGPCMGDHGYYYLSDEYIRVNAMGPFFTVNVDCGANCRAGAMAACPEGQYRHSVDGTCRTVCADGGLSLPDGTCPAESPACGTGRVRDPGNLCVRACGAMSMTTSDQVALASVPAVASWTFPMGYQGHDRQSNARVWTCSNPDGCRLDCPAPNCCYHMTANGPACAMCE
ncbi:MAG: C1 family peptidase [Polyangiales bacterium]